MPTDSSSAVPTDSSSAVPTDSSSAVPATRTPASTCSPVRKASMSSSGLSSRPWKVSVPRRRRSFWP
ncbi:Uncharacterised protein [Bordetella pertussis]|nr:Uncharacterised protein [Bordetella pertussis]